MEDLFASDLSDYIGENDVKFIRLSFCDLFGVQKNIAVMPGMLPAAVRKGAAFYAGQALGYAPPGIEQLYLRPDPATLITLPWRPQHGRVARLFCDIVLPGGEIFEGDTRAFLRGVSQREGSACEIGWRSSFYLFLLDEKGEPTRIPHDRAGYCDVAPLDKGENVRREICLTLEEMGIATAGSCHGAGPGQHRIETLPARPLAAADQFMTFKWVVKTIAARNGLHASFLPKPLPGEADNSLFIFVQECGCRFVEAALAHLPELEAFLQPAAGSRRREAASMRNCEAPDGAEKSGALALDFADPSCNPYLAFGLLLQAGRSDAEHTGSARMPAKTLGEALERAQESAFLREHLPPGLLRPYLALQRERWESCRAAADPAALEERIYYSV